MGLFDKVCIFVMSFILVIAVLAVSLASIGLYYRLQEPYKERVKLAHVAPPVFEYAHAYHGILSSHWSEKRKCYAFERDGKECRLFTKAFWSWYIKRYQKERNKDV